MGDCNYRVKPTNLRCVSWTLTYAPVPSSHQSSPGPKRVPLCTIPLSVPLLKVTTILTSVTLDYFFQFSNFSKWIIINGMYFFVSDFSLNYHSVRFLHIVICLSNIFKLTSIKFKNCCVILHCRIDLFTHSTSDEQLNCSPNVSGIYK